MRFFSIGVAALALVSCSGSAVTIGLDVGGESDAFKRAPAVATLAADTVDTAGNRTSLGVAKLPQTDFDLSDAPRSTYLSLEITGRDATDARVLFGRSVVLQLGAAEGTTLPVFVQRVGEWARMPGVLADARAKPLLAASSRTFLVAGGGDGTPAAQVLTGYDFATLRALQAYGVNFTTRSFAVANAAALLIGEDANKKSAAIVFDLGAASLYAIATPSGGGFDEVAGGPTIVGDDGESYVVGPARLDGAPSVRVLKITAAGVASFLSFIKPRVGAAAVWVKNRGLLVFGGSDSAKGAELLGKGATVGQEIDFPTDETKGAAAVVLDEKRVLLAGGTGGGASPGATRLVDPTCVSACVATPWSAALPIQTSFAQLFALAPAAALLVADDPAGATHSYRVEASTVTEIPLKIPRQSARAIRAPTGNVVLVGGGTTTVESFMP